jgi:hypothetical protein
MGITLGEATATTANNITVAINRRRDLVTGLNSTRHVNRSIVQVSGKEASASNASRFRSNEVASGRWRHGYLYARRSELLLLSWYARRSELLLLSW